MVLDELGSEMGAGSWVEKFKGLHCRGSIDGERVDLLKPTTFMNLAGTSVAMAASYYKIDVDGIIVVHDDLDLPFGTVRVKKGGGAGGHKGVTSVMEELSDAGFVRIRMGIGRPPGEDGRSETTATDYVLSNFSQEEVGALTSIIACGAKAASYVVLQGVAAAMNEFNRRGTVTDAL
jgi:PTH1 family peptidyl-tRNA hydrolase